MYEGSILKDYLAETGDGLALRELAWNDLVARLAASRDLRGEFPGVPFVAGGGFEGFAQLRQEAGFEGKRGVNRNALVDGKIDKARGNDEAATDAAECDRETK